MTDGPTRRRVLRAATAAGSLAAFGPAAARGDRRTVRLVEAGIRYEVPERTDYERFHLDSRPRYTVRSQRDELVGEQAAAWAPVSIDGAGERVSFLPTALSARKRVRTAIALSTEHELPTVTVDWNADSTTAIVTAPSHSDTEVPPESTREIAFDEETVAVRTETVADRLAPVEPVPDWQASVQRTPGTATVEAVPTVAVTNHGELVVTEEPLA